MVIKSGFSSRGMVARLKATVNGWGYMGGRIFIPMVDETSCTEQVMSDRKAAGDYSNTLDS